MSAASYEVGALRFVALSEDTLDAYERFHARPEGQGCFCAYWHFAGDNRAWQLRTPEENRALVRERVRAGSAYGVLALAVEAGGVEEPVGWLQCAPRAALVKLTHRMPYRGLDASVPEGAVWSISCIRVRDDARRRGVARGLVRYVMAYLREAHRAGAVEAYPRRADDLREDELASGPEALFASEGFELVRDHMQYPVLRATLR